LYERGTATNILPRQFIPGAIPFRGGGSLYNVTAAAGGKRDLARDALVLRPRTNQYTCARTDAFLSRHYNNNNNNNTNTNIRSSLIYNITL
jgi:hypothetical protein